MLAEYCVFRVMLLTRDALFYSKEKSCFGFLRGKENIDLIVEVGECLFCSTQDIYRIISSAFHGLLFFLSLFLFPVTQSLNGSRLE